MKKLIFTLSLVIFSVSLFAQINAGPDQTICPPQSATLTATFTPPIPGTTVSLSDDQYTGVVNIGFPFTYFGSTYSTCLISSNNYITFNTASAGGYSPWVISAAIPSASNPTNSIMCPWQDLLPPSGGTIQYATVGTAPNRVFVVSFCSIAMFSCTSMQFTSQIKLYEGSNIIETHITNKPLCSSWNGGYAIHGIQNAAGNIAYVVPGRNYPSQWTTSNEGYRFTPTGVNSYSQGFIPYSPTNIGTSTSNVSWYVGNTLVGTGPTITVTPSTTTTYTASITYACNVVMTDQVVVNVGNLTTSVTPSTSTVCQNAASVQLTCTANNAITYSWSPATGLSCTTCANPVATPSVSTTYTVSVSNGMCTGSATATVNVTPMPTVNAGADVTICQGASTTLSGTSSSPNYSWSPSTGLSCTNCQSPVANPTVTTTYTLTTAAGFCLSQDQVTVNVTPLPTVSAGPDLTICPGGSTTLNGSGSGTYSWTPSGTLSCNTCATPTANPAATTTYTLTVTQSGCTNTDQMTLSVMASPPANAGIDDTICPGGNTVLNASGGVSYSWLPATGLSNPSIANPVASPSVTTTYTVTVTGASGCTATDAVTIVVPQQLTLATAGFPATCNGSCNGQTVVIPSGGVQPYSYLWSAGGQTTASVMNQCAGTYTIQVTDAIGCTASSTVTVTEPTAIALTTSSVNAHCFQADGSATVAATGGTPPYSYLWPSGGNNATEPNLSPGQYCVTVTDANNCTATVCVTVNNQPGVSASITSSTNTTCFASCDGSSTVTGTIGNTPYVYSWAPAGGTAATATGLCAGTYTVTVTDANNCSDTAMVTITEPAQLVATPAAPVTICIGQSTTLVPSATGGTGSYSYTWPNGGPAVSPVVTTPYDVFATDANGCTSATVTTTVTVNPPLSVTAAGTASICPGSSTSISAVGAGGDGTYTYTWYPGAMTGSSVSVTPAATTIYMVILSDGCTTPHDTDYVTVTVLPLPVVTFTSDVVDGCEPLQVNFANTTPNSSSVIWNFSSIMTTGNSVTSTLSSPTQTFNAPASYDVTLTVTDNNGCVNTATVPNYITVYPNPVADFTFGPQPTTVLYPEITFQDASLGQNINTWEWHFGDILDSQSSLQNPQFTYPDSGYYQVSLTVTTIHGCVDVAYHTVEIKADYAFYMPTAFTPNGDGLNDTFGPKGMGIDTEHFELMIFDRWGNMVFHTTRWMEEWDGTVYSQNIVQEDVFVWKAVFSDQYGSKHQYMGHVAVVK